MSDEAPIATETQSAHYDKSGLARRIPCSERHLDRMRDKGLVPPPVKLGALLRWNREVIEQWIADGCPPPAKSGRGSR